MPGGVKLRHGRYSESEDIRANPLTAAQPNAAHYIGGMVYKLSRSYQNSDLAAAHCSFAFNDPTADGMGAVRVLYWLCSRPAIRRIRD